jgi:type VI secretion system secreted protein Hcp
MTCYLRLDGIDGESVNRGHEKWFELSAFSWGVQSTLSPGRGGGAGIGRPVLEPLRVTLASTQSLPILFQAIVSGRHIAAAALDVVSAGEQPRSVLKWDLQDVLPTSLDVGETGGAAPVTTLALSYGRVTLSSTGQDAKGGIVPGTSAGWDLGRNQLV